MTRRNEIDYSHEQNGSHSKVEGAMRKENVEDGTELKIMNIVYNLAV